MSIIWGLSGASALSAALCIAGKYGHSSRVVYVFKPLTTCLMIAIAFAAGASESLYGSLVAVAMACALVGDVFLMLPRDRFMPGLASFLVAHVILIAAFAVPWVGVTWWLLVLVGCVAVRMFAVLAPDLGRMKAPVAAYVVVIGAMTWAACERWLATGSPSGLLAAVGAMLFLASDAALALNRFRAEFRSADAVVLSTYYASLWLTALSVIPRWA